MKHQKIVQALDRILYLIGKRRISCQGVQNTAADNETLWNPGKTLAIVRQVKYCYLLVYDCINSRKKMATRLFLKNQKRAEFLALYPSRFKSTEDFMMRTAL